jgi:hypothetical protein
VLVVEGHGRAAAQGPIAQGDGHPRPLPVEVVADAGVWPRGAQLRRTTGSSEAPLSSQNTITACRRRALRQIRRPVLSHPAGDGLLVTLDGAAGGALQPPAHAAQQLPGVAGMVMGPGEPLDHGGDAGKGPVVGIEP